MKILASSLVDTAQQFLHAGYISAYPRELMTDVYFPKGAPQLELDVAEALRLKSEAAAAIPSGTSSQALTLLQIPVGWSLLLALGSCLTALLVYFVWGKQLGPRGRLSAAFLLGATALLPVLACGRSTPPRPPWQGVVRQEYLHPEDATRVILHGIIADGIINAGEPIRALTEIQEEVGLPQAHLTPGEAYALRTYGLDGWGREFRLVPGDVVTVSSAGADGSFGTGDDIVLTTKRCDDKSWDNLRHAFFVVRNGSSPLVAFHRWKGKHFRYHDEGLARRLTGSALFDVVEVGKLRDEQRKRVEAALGRVGSSALVIQVFESRTD